MKKRYFAGIIIVITIGIAIAFDVNYIQERIFYKFSKYYETYSYITKNYHVINNINSYVKLMKAKNNLRDSYLRVVPNKNAAHYLTTNTPDKRGQANHPDMVYFSGGYLGYKYWMACTPYPFSMGKYEEPNLLVSKDGLHFEEPKNGIEPIVPPPIDVRCGGHLSDTDMYFENGKFIMHYVYNKTHFRGPSKFYRIESTDGIHWSIPKLTYLCTETEEGYSPAYVKEGAVLKMWYIGGEGKLVYTQSIDNERIWTSIVRCKINMQPWKPWHVDIIKTNEGYEGLLCARNVFLGTRALFYILSSDGINFKCSINPIIFPSKNAWDNGQIYRSTMIKENGKYRIWYSAMSKIQVWHIGYTEFTDSEINSLQMN